MTGTILGQLTSAMAVARSRDWVTTCRTWRADLVQGAVEVVVLGIGHVRYLHRLRGLPCSERVR